MKLDNLPWTVIAGLMPLIVAVIMDYTTFAAICGVAVGWAARYELLKRMKPSV